MEIGDETDGMMLVEDVTSMCSGEAQSLRIFGFLLFTIASCFGNTDSKLMDGSTGGGGGVDGVSTFLPNGFVGLKLSAMRVKLNDRLFASINFGSGNGGGGGNRAGDQIGCGW